MKNGMKAALREYIGWTRYLLHQKELRHGLTIFAYHDVSEHPSPFSRNFDLNVQPELFDFQIGFLKKHFNIISPDDLLAGNIPERAAMITADDGLLGFFTNGLPILRDHRVPAIVFMNMTAVQGEPLWAGVLTFLAEQPDFLRYFKKKKGELPQDRSVHSSMDRTIVRDFFQETGLDPGREILEFTGEIATEEVLQEADENPYIYFGNHLDNHYVPLFLSDEELLASFQKNQQILSRYSSARKIFSFPFGQPKIHFSWRQARLLLENGAEKVLFSSGTTNTDSSQNILDRMPLFSFDQTAGHIWFRVFRMRNRT